MTILNIPVADTATPGIGSSVCRECSLRKRCFPAGLVPEETEQFGPIVHHHRPLARGEHLYRAGRSFDSLFVIRGGTFKTYRDNARGLEQVLGFPMKGEILGLDGIANDRHTCSAVALESSDVCTASFDQLERLARTIPVVQQNVRKVLSREIVREQGMIVLLGSLCTEERVAAFLLQLSRRRRSQGFSADEFVLPMTREEIGNYLGMTMESVSRVLSALRRQGLIAVEDKAIRIESGQGLRALVMQESSDRAEPAFPS